ncbi:MAG: YebC/PmpR family DNA-binding transcriptional regulator [Cyclobacteriaceae bacterium]|nr:YebC/PmpR family DNA-binding transcriptional regulator [Cyclobacteriaceae bacterium]
MSGHSKWATIKRKKGAIDAKRGKIFTKLIKEISIAARLGGGEPDANPRLRLAIQNAKGQNMPKDNIERAIKKATGADATEYFEVTFEGYGPHGVAIFVECTTDNNNRAVSNVRSLFTKYGGNLGTNGSLEFIFDRKGNFSIKLPDNFDEDAFMLEIIDAGAEDVEVEDGYVNVTCGLTDFGSIQKKLDEMGIEVEDAELQRVPKTTVSLEDDAFQKVMKLVDSLEDNDDVQKVFHNIEVSDAQMELV